MVINFHQPNRGWFVYIANIRIPYTQCGMIPIPHKETRHPHSGRGTASGLVWNWWLGRLLHLKGAAQILVELYQLIIETPIVNMKFYDLVLSELNNFILDILKLWSNQGASARCLHGIGHGQHWHHQNIRLEANLRGAVFCAHFCHYAPEVP